VPQSRSKRLRGGQPGPRPLRISEIPVVDPLGNRMKVYIREFRQALASSQVERKQVAYELVDGERLQLVDKDTFKSASTGKRFVRLSD